MDKSNTTIADLITTSDALDESEWSVLLQEDGDCGTRWWHGRAPSAEAARDAAIDEAEYHGYTVDRWRVYRGEVYHAEPGADLSSDDTREDLHRCPHCLRDECRGECVGAYYPEG